MDIAINAGFTFIYVDDDDDDENEYPETLSGEYVKVPKEKL